MKRPTVRLSLKVLSKRQLRTVLKKGLRLRAGCSTSCKLTLRISVDTNTAKRLKIARASRTVGIGRVTISGRDRAVTVKLTRKGKRLLAHAKSARLVVEAATAGTGSATKRRAVSAAFKR